MPAAIAIPLAIGAGTAVAGVAGAKIQAGAAKSAAATESNAAQQAGAYTQNATNQALGYIQNQQAGIQHAPTYTGVQSYGGGSTGAYNTMTRLLGGQAPPPPSPNMSGTNLPIAPSYSGMFSSAPTSQPMSAGAGQTPAAAAQAGMVMMQAPTGQTKAVPAAQVAQYEARGARRL